MEIIGSLSDTSLPRETVLTIGAFDGLHLGHQALVRGVVSRAHDTDRLAALITFHPHPAAVLAPDRDLEHLTTPAEKSALLEAIGLDLLVLLAFDHRTADTPAKDFMVEVSRQLRVKELWVGADFALGRNREGDVARLSEVGQELGFEIHVADPVTIDGRVVSSSRIRSSLRQGQVEEATRLLGRYPSISGRANRGMPQDWLPGVPMAFLEVGYGRAMPAEGAYAAFAQLGDLRIPAVANVGQRLGSDQGQLPVGVHISGLGNGPASHDRIYGCDLVIEFVSKLHPTKRYRGVDESVAQLERDIEEAHQLLEPVPNAGSRLQESRAASGSLASACPYRYEEVEHTADRALSVWGSHLSDLFAGAARGMYSLVADLEGLVPTTWRQLRLEDWDRESLLVAWLNELLFLTESEGLLFVDCQIESLTDSAIVAQVGCMPGTVSKAGIKAATFHDLTLERDDDGWATVITFDV